MFRALVLECNDDNATFVFFPRLTENAATLAILTAIEFHHWVVRYAERLRKDDNATFCLLSPTDREC